VLGYVGFGFGAVVIPLLIAFRRVANDWGFFLVTVCVLGALLCGLLAILSALFSVATLTKRSTAPSKSGLYFGLAAVILVVLDFIAIPNLVKARPTVSRNACINNLRQLDGAKEQWALENKKSAADTPTWADLIGSDKYIKVKPTCQQGGTYTLGDMKTSPICSVNQPGHQMIRYEFPQPKPIVIRPFATNSVFPVPPAVFNQLLTLQISLTTLTSNQIVLAFLGYEEKSGRLPNPNLFNKVVVGTVEDGLIAWGNPVVFPMMQMDQMAVAALSANRFVLVYRDPANNYFGTARVGSVIGNTIRLGDPVRFNHSNTTGLCVDALSSNQFVVAYHKWERHFTRGTAIVGTLADDTIQFGKPLEFTKFSPEWLTVAALSPRQFVVVTSTYHEPGLIARVVGAKSGGGWVAEAMVGTVTDDIIKYGAATPYFKGHAALPSVARLKDDEFVVAYSDVGDGRQGKALLGKVTKDSISFGPPALFNRAKTVGVSVGAFTANQCVVAFGDYYSNEEGKVVLGTVSGPSLRFDKAAVFNPNETEEMDVKGVTPKYFVVAYRDGSISHEIARRVGGGKVIVGRFAP
jgi:hypothetical protein